VIFQAAPFEPAIEVFELRLIDSEIALAVRFVILNFLYRLAHFTGFLSESSAPEIHRAVWPHLVALLFVFDIDPTSTDKDVDNSIPGRAVCGSNNVRAPTGCQRPQ